MKQIFPKPPDAPAPKLLTLGDLAPGEFFVFVDYLQKELCLKLDYNSLYSGKSSNEVRYVQFSAGQEKIGPVLDGHSPSMQVRRVNAAVFELPQDPAVCPK